MHHYWKFVCPILVPLIALFFQWNFWDYLKPYVWFLFFPAVFFSARFSGFWGGIVATLLSVLIVTYFFIPPQLQWAIENSNSIPSMILFIIMGILFSYTHEQLKLSNRRAQSALHEVEKSNQKITELYQQSLELDKIKTSFFASVSHEFRTPLTLILGTAKKRLDAVNLSDAERRDLEVLSRNASILQKHINNLLDVTKLQAGAMTIEYSEFDLAELTRIVASYFDSTARERHISFECDSPEILMAQIDVEKCQRILLNLVANAFKFTPDNGHIILKLSVVSGQAVWLVADNGPGIAVDMRQAIFNPFFQLERQGQRHYGGTGLGLAIVKDFVLLHKGSVVVDQSELGGAVFIVRLPLHAPESVSLVRSALENKWTGTSDYFYKPTVSLPSLNNKISNPVSNKLTPVVLVVDDNDDMRYFLQDILESSYQVICAVDGEQGLEMARLKSPDLIITDLMMTKMDGEDMVNALRSDQSLATIPIIVLSAKADDLTRIQLLKSGVQAYFTKPFLIEELLTQTSNLLADSESFNQKLKERDERWLFALEAAGVGVWDWNAETNKVFYSSLWKNMLGYQDDEVGDTFDDWQTRVHPDDLEACYEALDAHFRGEIPHYESEHRLRCKDGSYKWVMVRGRMIEQTPEGKPKRVIGTHTDITYIKTINNQLLESERRFKTIFNNVSDGLIVLEPDGQILEWNPSALSMHDLLNSEKKLNRFEALQEHLELRTLDDSLLDVAYWPKARVLRGESFQNLELLVRHKQKYWQRIYSFNGNVVKDENGQINMGLLTIRDLTQYKTNEAMLHLQARALNAATHAIMISDLNGTVEWVNQAFADLSGYSAEETVGHNPRELIRSGKTSPILYENLWQTIKSGDVWVGELVNRRKDGSCYDEEQTITPVADESGQIHHFIAIKQDISERKWSELVRITQSQLLELIATGASLSEILDTIVLVIEKLNPNSFASILILADDGLHLQLGSAPNMAEVYNQAIDGIAIGEGVGSCGTSAWRREQVIVENIANDPLWVDFKDLALGHGLQACWSSPIKDADGAVLGTFAIYYPTPKSPTFQHEQTINMATHVAAIALARVKEEKLLQESEQTYRTLFSNMLNGFAHCRMLYENDQPVDFIYLSVNQSFEKQTGLKNVIGKKVTEVIPNIRATTPELFEIYGRVAMGGQQEQFEIFVGPLLEWFAVSVYSPKHHEFVAIFDRVTERKQYEEKLRKLSMAVEQSPEGILIANINEEIEFVNDAYIRMSGYDADELIGHKLSTLALGLTPQSNYVSLWRSLKKGKSWQGKVTHCRKNGEVFTNHEVYSPIRQSDGVITHYLSIQEDITQKKLLTEELDNYRYYLEDIARKRSDEVSYLYNNAPCGYHSLDKNGVVVEINNTELSWLGYKREDVVNQLCFKDIIAPYDHVLFNERYPKFIREGHIDAMEFDLMRKDGSFLPIVLTANAVYDEQGQFVKSLSTTFDNTESKERENRIAILNKELVEQAKQAKIATQAKSAFLANMSHEIRTPMNAVLGFCYLLHQKHLQTEAQNLVQKIQAASHSLLAIINDILDFSKIEAGRLELESASFQLSAIIDNIAGIVGNAVGNKQLELIISPPATPKADFLIGDALRLQQILINLLSNAIKFTERGEVSLKINVVAEQQNTITLQFVVRDTGIGISQDKLKEIFRAFSQADYSTARQFGGTGLGLAISRQLVELMGGQLEVSSHLGHGSVFSFSIAFDLDSEKKSISQHLDNLRLLVGDDCESSRGAIKNTAEMLGWKTDIAESGESTVRHVLTQMQSDNHYDVILLDWMMPDLDGLQTAKKIKSHYKDTKNVPIVIMVTAYSQQALMTHPEIGLVDSVLSKPVTKLSLYNAVLEAINKNKPHHLPAGVEKLSAQRLSGIRVLVVDDSEINLEVAQLILEGQGAAVKTVSNGQEVLDWLQQHPDTVDIVLMDIQMPVMDGYATTRVIRQDPRWKNLPIVALSAGVFSDLQDAAIEAGMNGFIAKPIDVESVIAEILKLTGHWFDRLSEIESCVNQESEEEPEQIESYPGIDMEYGLRQWGSRDVYQTFLEKFAEVYVRAGDEIATFVQNGDSPAALALVHKLRGAAGNLALKKVAEQARLLEGSVSAGKPSADDAEALQELINKACHSITQLPAKSYKGPEQALTNNPDQQALSLLWQLLEALNQDSPHSVEPLLGALRTKIAEADWVKLNECVSNFDFRGAEQGVHQLLVTL